MYQHIIDTPIGWFRLIGNETHVISSGWIVEEEAVVGGLGSHVAWKTIAEEQIRAYFNSERTQFTIPVQIEGTDFQKAVWNALADIRFGQRSTYKAISVNHGGTNMSRAIGQAIGSNPLLLLVPCHRVLGTDGSITGYAGGEDRKQWLLKHEGVGMPEQLSLF